MGGKKCLFTNINVRSVIISSRSIAASETRKKPLALNVIPLMWRGSFPHSEAGARPHAVQEAQSNRLAEDRAGEAVRFEERIINGVTGKIGSTGVPACA